MIDVYAEGPIDQEEMAWFLSQKCFVSMDGLGTGVGPGDSVVLPVVDWEAEDDEGRIGTKANLMRAQPQVVSCLAQSPFV